MLGFLRRILRNISQETKTRAFNSLVRCCCTVWKPHQRSLINKLEMVHRRAARFVTNRYHNTSSVTDMLTSLEWLSLENRRQHLQLSMFFKIIHHLVDINKEDYLTPAPPRTRSPHNTRFLPYSTRSDTLKFSFFPRCIPLWNRLPATVAAAHSLASLKSVLSPLTF